ncbi:hypothetical protein AUF78_10395 [archaeon 13_1_20CM_2_51_12]|nr:MAG: hypothetical protein AUF78_10395 [archaeon 13_1_20CM_2_51_12]
MLFILLVATPMFPHILPVLPATPGPQVGSALSSGVLMALHHVTGSAKQLVSSISSDDVQVSTSILPQNEPSITVNPSNPQNLVAGANDQLTTRDWLAIYTSPDGGLTWTNGLVPTTGNLAGFMEASDPAVSFTQNGTLYYSGIAFNVDRRSATAIEGTIFVSKSTDGGSSFPLTTIVASGSSKVGGTFNDKPYLAVDDTTGPFAGRVYVSWTRFNSGGTSDIIVAYSKDGGATFSSSSPVSNSVLNQGSVPVVGSDGSLYIVWNDLSNSQIMETKSIDGGVSFSSPVVVSPTVPLPLYPNSLASSFFKVNSNPTAAADDTNGNVYVAWADYGNGYAIILSSRSPDGGVTWSKPIRVNDDTTTHDHFFPWMTVSQGLVSIVFYDRRLDPGNRLIDVFYAESADHGVSWSSNLRVTDRPSDPGTLTFIGDYIGIASNGPLAHPVWTDLRTVSPNNPNEHIFTEGRRVDRPPFVAPVPSQTVYPGSELRFGVKAMDPDVGETLTLADLGAPSGSTFTSTPSSDGTVTGSFDWTPRAAQAPGNYSVEFNASDGFLASSANVSIMVKMNGPPSLVVPGPQTVTAGSKLTFTVSATDPDAPPDSVTLSCNNCTELGATFDPSSGIFIWVPASGPVPGEYSANFTATDHLLPSLSDSKTVSIRVVEVEQPLVLTVPGAQTVDAGNLLIFSVSATDPDADDIITLSAIGLPAGASFDPDLGSFVWTPGNSQGPGVYTVTFKAVEPGPQGFSDTKTVTITVSQPVSSSGQPSGTGGLGPRLWLAAGGIVLVMALVSILAVRPRRGKKGLEEGAKI